jgi:arylsulfotransferase ASST
MNKRTSRPTGFLAALLLASTTAAAPQAGAAPSGAPGQAGAAARVIVSPLPGTVVALPGTQISFLGAVPSELLSISVMGSVTGRHGGRLRGYVSAFGASFIPTHPFTPGEHVSVRATLQPAKGHATPLSTSFTVGQPMPVTSAEFPKVPGTGADEQSFVSQPALHPPVVSINQAGSIAPGYVFAAPFMGPGQYGPMIFDDHGGLVWFHPVPAGEDAADFKVQRYGRQNVLTWWEGHTIILGYGHGEGVIADDHYRTLALVRAGNGLQADEHELTVTPRGTAFITAYSPVKADLSSAGGPSDGLALDCAVQEIDVKTGLVMWEWHSLGHVNVSESYSTPPRSPGPNEYLRAPSQTPYDYFHLNSVELLPEGNLLISARNTWALYKLNTHSGAIVWRLGGKRSTFALGPGVRFAYQHDARVLKSGAISLFDDEGAPTVKPPTRGEIIRLDLKAKTATLAQSFVRTSEPLITGSQGDVQLLGNGNRMIGWGGLPNFTEFNASGGIVFDGQFPKGEMSYRVYRYVWAGQPAQPPAIAATIQRKSAQCPLGARCPLELQTTVYMSWNGATGVASWRVLWGSSLTRLKPIARVRRSGFETNVTFPGTEHYVRAQALGPAGKVLAGSPIVLRPNVITG